MNAAAGGSSRPPRRVQSRLLRVFVLQLALISAAAALGVLGAGYVAERLLVNRALVGEADYFWTRRAEDPAFPLPDTLNLHAWLTPGSAETLPEGLETLPTGRQRLVVDGHEQIVYVSERGDERLYLLFQAETVSRLAFWFGLVPLALVLLVTYGLAGLAYLLSKRAVSPLARLASAIETFDFAARDADELDLGELRDAPDSETRVFVDALDHFIERSQRSLERERNFTRYASHELRTPLAVIAGSVSSLELAPLDGAPARALARIRRTTRHMSELLAALLLLARDAKETEDDAVTDVGALLDRLATELDDLDASGTGGDTSDAEADAATSDGIAPPERDRGASDPTNGSGEGARRAVEIDETGGVVPITVHHGATLLVRASEAPLTIVLGNLLRNARAYTAEGRVDVVVEADTVAVVDTGPGLDAVARQRVFEPFYRGDAARSPGHGLGLAIARKTCENQGWRLAVESAPGEGSTFRVAFRDAVARSPVRAA